jgi:hypothetical protein
MKKFLTISLVLIMLLNNITVIADDLIDNTNETPVVETTEATDEVETKEEVVPEVEKTEETITEEQEEVVETTKEEITVKKEEIVEEKKLEEKTITSTPKTKLKAGPVRELEDTLSFVVNVYINNTYLEQVTFGNGHYPEINGGELRLQDWLVVKYGEFKGGNVYINGVKRQLAPFPTTKPYQSLFLVADGWYYTPVDGDEIIFNLNFAGKEEPKVYGTAVINIHDQNGNPIPDYELTFTSKPATKTITGKTDETGKLVIDGEQLDVSLTWQYEFNGTTYELRFDENNYCEYSLTIIVEEEPVETDINGKINIYVNEGKTDEVDILTKNNIDTIKEGKINYSFNATDTHEFDKGTITVNGENEKAITYNEENKTFTFEGYTDIKAGDTVEVNLYFKNKIQKEFKITVEHQINVEQINVNNGYSDKETSVLIKGKEITVKAGETVNYNDIVNPVNSEFTINDDETITYNGDKYRFSGKFAEGGSGYAFTGSVHDLDLTRGSTFVMPNTDIHIIENYLIVVPEYTVTINYIDMDTNKAFVREDSFVYPDGSKQQDYTPVVKEFTGSTNGLGKKEYNVTEFSSDGKWFRSYPNYEFVKAEGEFTGEMNEDKVINMYYKKLEGKVIVHYIDIEDNTLLDDVILTGKVGETYLTKEEAIENFELVKVEGDYTGTYTKDDIEVTYIYTAIGTGGEEVPEEKDVNPQTSDDIKNNIISLVMSMNALALTLYLLKKNH